MRELTGLPVIVDRCATLDRYRNRYRGGRAEAEAVEADSFVSVHGPPGFERGSAISEPEYMRFEACSPEL
jgi:hypothetical protein